MSRPFPQRSPLVKELLPTRDEAVAFVDRVVARLGENGAVQASNRGRNRSVFARSGRDGRLVIPWPVLSIAIADPPPGEELPSDEARVITPQSAWEGGPAEIQLTFQPMPAVVTIHDGALSLGVEYGWRGKARASSEPGEQAAFGDLAAALGTPGPGRIERLVQYVASLDPGRHGPARVHWPRPTRQGIPSAWFVGRAAIREAMATRRAPAGSFWAVADGYVGTAIAFGASRAEAFEAWLREVERVKPKPPPPPTLADLRPPPPDEAPPGSWRPDDDEEVPIVGSFDFSGCEAPPYDPSPAAVPAAAVRVAALPPEKPPLGTWTRWVGDLGVTHFAVRLPVPGGATLVGRELLPHVDLATLNATLDELDEAHRDLVGDEGFGFHAEKPYTHSTVYYRVIDLRTGLPMDPRPESSQRSYGFDATRFSTHVVRMRQIDTDG